MWPVVQHPRLIVDIVYIQMTIVMTFVHFSPSCSVGAFPIWAVFWIGLWLLYCFVPKWEKIDQLTVSSYVHSYKIHSYCVPPWTFAVACKQRMETCQFVPLRPLLEKPTWRIVVLDKTQMQLWELLNTCLVYNGCQWMLTAQFWNRPTLQNWVLR